MIEEFKDPPTPDDDCKAYEPDPSNPFDRFLLELTRSERQTVYTDKLELMEDFNDFINYLKASITKLHLAAGTKIFISPPSIDPLDWNAVVKQVKLKFEGNFSILEGWREYVVEYSSNTETCFTLKLGIQSKHEEEIEGLLFSVERIADRFKTTHQRLPIQFINQDSEVLQQFIQITFRL